MIHYLRTSDNRTIISCDVSSKDLRSAVELETYSRYLLSLPYDKHEFITQISQLDELRGMWWEMEEDSGKWKNIDEFVAYFYKQVSFELDLLYITD